MSLRFLDGEKRLPVIVTEQPVLRLPPFFHLGIVVVQEVVLLTKPFLGVFHVPATFDKRDQPVVFVLLVLCHARDRSAAMASSLLTARGKGRDIT